MALMLKFKLSKCASYSALLRSIKEKTIEHGLTNQLPVINNNYRWVRTSLLHISLGIIALSPGATNDILSSKEKWKKLAAEIPEISDIEFNDTIFACYSSLLPIHYAVADYLVTLQNDSVDELVSKSPELINRLITSRVKKDLLDEAHTLKLNNRLIEAGPLSVTVVSILKFDEKVASIKFLLTTPLILIGPWQIGENKELSNGLIFKNQKLWL